MGTTYTEQWTDTPLADIIPSYIYKEFQDDPNVIAFSDGINSLAQGYLDWFNQTPMAVYTNANVSGPLLDWVGVNLYGIARPVISTSSTSSTGELATNVLGEHTLGTLTVNKGGTAQVANDDIYKRTLTWLLYRGDGVQMSVEWLRRRIARFLYGVDGTDIDVGLIVNVSIVLNEPSGFANRTYGAYNTYPYDTNALDGFFAPPQHQFVITIPAGTSSNYFLSLFNSGYLPAPFQMTYITGVS